jgi:hypothetical protein
MLQNQQTLASRILKCDLKINEIKKWAALKGSPLFLLRKTILFFYQLKAANYL